VIALVATGAGAFAVDLEYSTVLAAQAFHPAPEPVLNLPRLVAAAALGPTVAAVVATKPPLLLSYDAGATWRASGRGLPPGRAVAIAGDDPDVILFAARNRLFLSRDGGVFWTAIVGELPEIRYVALEI
jgi:hypothetical protein